MSFKRAPNRLVWWLWRTQAEQEWLEHYIMRCKIEKLQTLLPWLKQGELCSRSGPNHTVHFQKMSTAQNSPRDETSRQRGKLTEKVQCEYICFSRGIFTTATCSSSSLAIKPSRRTWPWRSKLSHHSHMAWDRRLMRILFIRDHNQLPPTITVQMTNLRSKENYLLWSG